MKEIEIFERQASCTCTDKNEFDRKSAKFSSAVSNLRKNGFKIKRYDYKDAGIYPQVKELIAGKGTNILPITVVDREIYSTREYPSNREIAQILGVLDSYLEGKISPDEPGKCSYCYDKSR